MIDISVHELNKYYGANHVIKGISFEIYSGEKVGLLGKNGSGKTTVFKILADMENYESGAVSKANGKKIEMLAQIPDFGENDTTEDILYSSFKEITDVYKEMKKIEGGACEDSDALKRYGRLMDEYERLGGYDMEVKIEKICNGMNIDERMRGTLFSSLSGGEKTRVNLARILLRDCDILLLDEPTNHLDLTSLNWIESFLKEFFGTVIVISHDRAFLDNVVDRIIEIEDGKLNFYQGNYTYYVEEKERRFLSQTEMYEQQQKKIRQLEAAAKRMHEWARIADNKAMHRRAFSIEKRIERMDKVEKPRESKKINEDFGDSGFSGKEIVTFSNVGKSYESKTVADNLNLKIFRGDSIALIGENGCGKSTLIKMITGEELCDSGEIKVGDSTRIAYMPQIVQFENNNATVLETLRYVTESGEEKARNILAGFHFKNKDVFKKVGTLSGGEKSRLKLCLLMQTDLNFLILDEPTNHLDIQSREWIEDAVFDFDGTILFVSHDRYFLNKFTSKVWSMENGSITESHGGFDEYVQHITNSKKKEKSVNMNMKKKSDANSQQKHQKPKEKTKSDASSKRLGELEIMIAEAEEKIKLIDAEIETTGSDYIKASELIEEKDKLQQNLDLIYSEWMELSAL